MLCWSYVCISVYACVVLCRSHWMRACRVVWTGRCRSGSCVCWGSAVWPASSPGQSSDSASYSGPPRLVFAAGVCMDNSLLSPLCGRRAEMEICVKSLERRHKAIIETSCMLHFVSSLYPLRRRYHQAPSMRPPAQPPWLRVSQEIRFWGDS